MGLWTRRGVLAGLLATVALPVRGEAPKTSLRPKARPLRGAAKVKAAAKPTSIKEIVAASGLTGSTSIVVADAFSGKILESHQPLKTLPPASVTKAVTALYALHHLGSEFRTQTQVVATGPIANGVVQGDLVLVGGGDPQLDTDGLAKLAKAVRGRGITGVTGAFRVYSGALPYQQVIDRAQPDHVGYNPAISGLNLNFNRVYFEWKRQGGSYAVTMDARTKRLRPQVRGVRMGIVDRAGPLFAYRAKSGARGEEWTVMRGALGKGGGRWLPVRDVDSYVGEVFRTVAAGEGVRLPAAQTAKRRPKGTVLAAINSGTLREQARGMLKFSTNLTAEVMGLTTTRQRGSGAKTLAASAREMTNWTRRAFGVSKAKFVDHSGLGDASRVSGGDMVKLLAKSGWNGPLRPVLKDIQLVNSKGKPAPIEGVSVFAKTGTLNFASSLAGFIECPNGRKLAFAIFTADMGRRAKIKKADRERPEGGRAWARRSKRMQQKLLRHWALTYGVEG